MQFSRQEFWSGLPFPSPQHGKDCPNKVKSYGVFKLSKKLAESKEARGTAAQLARLVPGKFVFSVLSRTKFINKLKQTKMPIPKMKIIRGNDWCGPQDQCGQVVQFSSVAQSYLTLGNPMNRSTPGLPVDHHLTEFTQTHVHRVRDAIQPSHLRSSPSPPAPNPSQHQSLFQ